MISVFNIFQAQRGRDWFVFVTNLSPCVGVRVHLWPETGLLGEKKDFDHATEVTMKIVQLPSGPTPPQVCVRLHKDPHALCWFCGIWNRF